MADISPAYDEHELPDNFEVRSTTNDAKCETVVSTNHVSLTSYTNDTQLTKNEKGATSNSLNGSVATLDQPSSTDHISMSEFPLPNNGSSISSTNLEQYRYGDIPKDINNIMISVMKDCDSNIDILPFLVRKIRIRSKITIHLINSVTKLKDALKKVKRQVDSLKLEHPNERQTQCMKILETVIDELDDLPFRVANNSAHDVTPKRIKDITFKTKCSKDCKHRKQQDIHDVIPGRIKDIILKTKWSKNSKALGFSTLEAFFNKAKNEKNVRIVAKSLNIHVCRLKKLLKEIKRNYDGNPKGGNKEEKQFMKRLERIISSLNRRPSAFDCSSAQDTARGIPKRTRDIITKMKSGTLDISELKSFLNKAKNRKNVIKIAKSSETGVEDIKKYLNAIKGKCRGNLESGSEEEKQFIKRLERIIKQLDCQTDTTMKKAEINKKET